MRPEPHGWNLPTFWDTCVEVALVLASVAGVLGLCYSLGWAVHSLAQQIKF